MKFKILKFWNLNISRMNRAFEMKWKTFFLVSKVPSFKKQNCPNLELKNKIAKKIPSITFKVSINHESIFKFLFTKHFFNFALKCHYYVLSLKKYLQSDWRRWVQYWLCLCFVFNICTLLLNKKNQHSISIAEK